jgi:hypothetical protein
MLLFEISFKTSLKEKFTKMSHEIVWQDKKTRPEFVIDFGWKFVA